MHAIGQGGLRLIKTDGGSHEFLPRDRNVETLLSEFQARAPAAVLSGPAVGWSDSPEAKVKDLVEDYSEAIIDGDNGRAGGLPTDVESCLGRLVLAQDWVPAICASSFEARLGEDWREKLDDVEVTFADDDTPLCPPSRASEIEPARETADGSESAKHGEHDEADVPARASNATSLETTDESRHR